MNNLKLLSLVFLVLSLNMSSQKDSKDKQVYAFYDSDGSLLSFEDVIKDLAKSDIILFGEFHNNPLIHWFQIEITKSLHLGSGKELVLGAEMFESDDQLLINEYLQGTITKENFESEAKIWKNYSTDYAQLLNFSKENDLPFIATNIPRRYASLVSRAGLDTLRTLSAEAKQYISPLPVEFSLNTPGYQEMMEMMGAHGHGSSENSEKFVQAQAMKDATMAYFILQNLNRKQLFIHFNGDYHSADYGGIYWYLKAMKKQVLVKTIKVHENTDLQWEQELKDSGDIILIVPEGFNKSY